MSTSKRVRRTTLLLDREPLHVEASVVTQMLLELVEAMGHLMSPGASGIIVFANERAAWP